MIEIYSKTTFINLSAEGAGYMYAIGALIQNLYLNEEVAMVLTRVET